MMENVKRIVTVGAGILLLGGCSAAIASAADLPDEPQYVVHERSLDNLTAGLTYHYEFMETDGEEENLLYTISPLQGERLMNLGLADDFEVRDAQGERLYRAEGKILTISAHHDVHEADGDVVYTMDRRPFGGLLGRMGRLAIGLDGYYLRDAEGEDVLYLQENWSSALLPFVRNYDIIHPESGEQIGEIAAAITAGNMFLNSQAYYIQVDEDAGVEPAHLAMLVRLFDGLEDGEDSSD